VCTQWSPFTLSICAPRYRPKPIVKNLAREPSGLGTLRPPLDWPFACFTLAPTGYAALRPRIDGQEPTTTCQPSDGRATFRMPKSIRRFAHHQMLSSGRCRPSTLTSNLSLNVYYQHSTNTPQTGGCTWRLPRTSTAFPFAVRLRRDTARRRLVTPVLARPTVALFTCMPFDITS
jgi:hypothetical protein